MFTAMFFCIISHFLYHYGKDNQRWIHYWLLQLQQRCFQTITTGTLSIGTNTDKNDSDNNIKIDTKNDSKMKNESEHNNCSSRKIKASM